MINTIVPLIYYITLIIIAFLPSGVNVFLIRSRRAQTKLIIALVIFQILWLAALYFLLLSLIAYLIDKIA